MPSISEIESLAFQLPVRERAALASRLLRSLPEVLSSDDGIVEAERRRQELLAQPGTGITMDELRDRISKRFEI